MKTDSKVSYTFKNGLEVKGTVEEIATIAKTLKLELDLTDLYNKNGLVPEGYYKSESKGVIEIKGMSDIHLRRALLKRAKQFYTDVFDKNDTNKQFLFNFTSMAGDKVVVALYNELAKRG